MRDESRDDGDDGYVGGDCGSGQDGRTRGVSESKIWWR